MRLGLARRLGLLALVAIPALAGAQQPSAAASAKPRVNVGVIGQTGAGKTTLTAAIVKLQTSKGLARDVGLDELDHPSTSTARGIALAMSNVEYETETRRYAHVDMPRSADYVKALITGAAKMDGALAYWLTQQEGGLSAPIKPGYAPQFYFRTADATGAIEMPESTTGRALPGEYTVIDVSLMAPVAIETGMRFAIRDGGRSVGAGVVVEVRD